MEKAGTKRKASESEQAPPSKAQKQSHEGVDPAVAPLPATAEPLPYCAEEVKPGHDRPDTGDREDKHTATHKPEDTDVGDQSVPPKSAVDQRAVDDKDNPESGHPIPHGTSSAPPYDASASRQFLGLLVVACEHQRVLVRHSRRCAKHQDAIIDDDDAYFSVERVETACHTKDLLQSQQIPRLHELAKGVNTDLATNPMLRMLPVYWFTDDMKTIKRHQRIAAGTKEAQRNVEVELAMLAEQEEALIMKRTDLLLAERASTSTPPHFSDLDNDIKALQVSTRSSLDEHSTLQERLDAAVQKERNAWYRALKTADDALVEAGLLQKFVGSEVPPGRGADRLRSPHPLQNSPDKRRGHQAPNMTHGLQKRRSMTEVGPRMGLPKMRTMIQDRKRLNMEAAKRAWSEASRDFRLVREEYDEQLAGFLRGVEQGDVSGTKTEFDADYFLAMNESNHRLALAQDSFERTKKAAQGIGALPLHQQTSDFGDQPDDISPDATFLVLWVDRETIEKWRRHEEQKLIELDESKWVAVEADGESDAVSIAAESSRSQDRYDTGRRQKLIKRWQAEQEEHRLREGRRRKEKID